MRKWSAVIAAGGFLSSSAPAFATTPYPGITHLTSSGVSGGGAYHTVSIDLTKWRIVATKRPNYGHPIATFAKEVGAVVAINSNYWAAATGPTCGLEVGQGVTASDSYQDSDSNNCRDSIGFRMSDGFTEAFDSYSIPKGPPPNSLTDVGTGMPFMVRDGVSNYNTIPKFGTTVAARTVFGISKDGKTAYFVVTQNGYRTNGSLVDVVANLGAYNAVNLDGGGSSILWIGSEGGIQNQPTDGQERLVASHLGVVPIPPAPPSDAGADAATKPDASEDASPPSEASDDGSEDAAEEPEPIDMGPNGCSCRSAPRHAGRDASPWFLFALGLGVARGFRFFRRIFAKVPRDR